MSWNPNSNKHKAEHSGYKKKPGKKEVSALLDMYAAIGKIEFSDVVKQSRTCSANKNQKVDVPVGTQLKLF